LEEYWEKTGRKYNFIRKEGNTLKYWVALSKKVSHNNSIELKGYGRQWNFPTENSEILIIEHLVNLGYKIFEYLNKSNNRN